MNDFTTPTLSCNATVTPVQYYGSSLTTAVQSGTPSQYYSDPYAPRSVAVIATLTDEDREALRTMIREEIAALKEDIAREVVKEVVKQTRLNAGVR